MEFSELVSLDTSLSGDVNQLDGHNLTRLVESKMG